MAKELFLCYLAKKKAKLSEKDKFIKMRTSNFFLTTLKEAPAESEIISHQLMLRAGLIRQVAAGIYNWLPLGYRVLKKVENIVRMEMDIAGALETLLPAVQPSELWKESGRWDDYGPELLRFPDRHQRDFCLGPTHEEVITNLIQSEIQSYRQLPLNLYQIQTKFRDEIRPRFGVMRSREFIMKDAYSFDIDADGMQISYQKMYDAYVRIFENLGLEAKAVEADSGTIGGNFSHEFHVMANTGEDAIAVCNSCDYAANVEKVELAPILKKRSRPLKDLNKVHTPNQKSIDDLCSFLKIKSNKALKTLIVHGTEDKLVAIAIRGDHELNPIKAEKLKQISKPLKFANYDEIEKLTNTPPGSIGPVNLQIPLVADHDAALLTDFVCGANEADYHLTGVNWGRDLKEPDAYDLRQAADGDPCPNEKDKTLLIRRGIEVGHVFQLGSKYSKALNATFLNNKGVSQSFQMGCYGIGITRIIAAAIEQNHDENGIIWPSPLAPFQVCIVPIGYTKSSRVREYTENLYNNLLEVNIETLLEDRNERPGVIFSEMDLIGIPHRIVVSERGLKNGMVEYRNRRTGESTDYSSEEIIDVLKALRAMP